MIMKHNDVTKIAHRIRKVLDFLERLGNKVLGEYER
jgi:hypothetical protein